MENVKVKYELIKRSSVEEIPHLKITVTTESGEEIGYLTPYRGYCFQVSSELHGGGDLGSTITMDLRSLIRGAALPYDGSKIVLELVYAAISRFAGCDASKENSRGQNFDTLLKFVHDAMDWLVYNRADELGLRDYYPSENLNVVYCDG